MAIFRGGPVELVHDHVIEAATFTPGCEPGCLGERAYLVPAGRERQESSRTASGRQEGVLRRIGGGLLRRALRLTLSVFCAAFRARENPAPEKIEKDEQGDGDDEAGGVGEHDETEPICGLTCGNEQFNPIGPGALGATAQPRRFA